MNALKAILGLGASLALAGCYLPEGTQRITGGSGQSVAACFVEDGFPEDCVELNAEGPGSVVVSAELMLQTRDEGGFEGRLQFNDRTSKLIVSGDVSFLGPDAGDSGVPSVFFEGPVRYKLEGGKFQPGYVVGSVLQVPARVPGDTQTGGEPRHAMVLCLNDGSVPTATDAGCGRGYFAVFEGGNYVFHGANGVIAR